MGGQFWSSVNITKNIAYLEEAREIWSKLGREGELGLARALQTLGAITLYNEDETSIPQSLFERSYELYQDHNNKRGIAWSTHNFGGLALVQGRFEEAKKQYTNSLAKFQELGDRGGMAFALASLGEVMRVVGDYDRASQYWEQNLEIFREIINHPGLIYSLSGLGWVSLRKGEHGKAKDLFVEALSLSTEYGNKPMVIYCISGLAGFLGSIGKPQQAAKLFSATDALNEEMGKLEPADQKDFDHYVNIVREQLDESEFQRAWNTGRTMTIEQAIEYTLEEMDE
jgi:tetratricopeptide (TPR) repeat protein